MRKASLLLPAILTLNDLLDVRPRGISGWAPIVWFWRMMAAIQPTFQHGTTLMPNQWLGDFGKKA